MKLRLLMSCLCLLCSHAAQATEWRFNALLDGKPIGEHRYTMQQRDDQIELLSEATFSVKYLYIEFFRYHHTAREQWRGGCLKDLQARTEENSDVSTVQGERQEAGFVVRDAKGLRTLPACASTYAYWNLAILQQQHNLLNPQTGAWSSMSLEQLGIESIQTSKRTLQARHYKLTADKTKIDLWYTSENQWVGLRSTTPEGRVITYQLTE